MASAGAAAGAAGSGALPVVTSLQLQDIERGSKMNPIAGLYKVEPFEDALRFAGTRDVEAEKDEQELQAEKQKNVTVPLSSLAQPRPLALPPLRARPTEVCELPDQSLIVADGDGGDRGGPALQLWPDGSRDPQQLPPATANATCVLPVEGGHLVVSYCEGRVERTGSTAWKRTDLDSPWSAVVVGDTVLVTEYNFSRGRVVRLALNTGATVGTLGDGILQRPSGIAVAATTEEIVVADDGTKLVHVFGGTSFTQLRTLGAGLLKNSCGVCLDGGGRVYVCDYSSVNAVLVLDGASGALLATIAVPGQPRGVRVTRTGAIVVTHNYPNGAVVIGPS